MESTGKVFEAVLALVTALVFMELLRSFFLREEVVAYLATLLTILMYIASGLNIYLKDKLFNETYVKPTVIKLDDNDTLIYQVVRFRIRRVCSLLFNVAGAIIPLSIAIIATIDVTLTCPVLAQQLLLNTLLLTFLYHKLSVIIKDKGIGVPIAVTVALTTVLSVTTAIYLSLQPSEIFLMTYASSTLALLVGVDLMNLNRVALFNVRKLVIGGMGIADALVLIPAISSLVTVNIVKVLMPLIY